MTRTEQSSMTVKSSPFQTHTTSNLIFAIKNHIATLWRFLFTIHYYLCSIRIMNTAMKHLGDDSPFSERH